MSFGTMLATLENIKGEGMSGRGKEVTGSRNFNKTIYVCIDCGEETSICFIDWGAGNKKDSPLCKECYMKRKEKYQGVGA